ncbi:hypothetical protein CF319_g7550 [Tilletia indica]|uniref:Uncharacterized protein n=1 Tax=Tilletia indica TaxID=43049 RepID=A0A177TTU1_9BASI|nr:hypothetical protein CF319_g7550 [Tilletia indica]KAE8228789.1 hypothetical protein CF326_g6266 [Tilletia indica]KAE8241378.1 hypothetical protein A4X13_0g7442 [Tilletia indica]
MSVYTATLRELSEEHFERAFDEPDSRARLRELFDEHIIRVEDLLGTLSARDEAIRVLKTFYTSSALQDEVIELRAQVDSLQAQQRQQAREVARLQRQADEAVVTEVNICERMAGLKERSTHREHQEAIGKLQSGHLLALNTLKAAHAEDIRKKRQARLAESAQHAEELLRVGEARRAEESQQVEDARSRLQEQQREHDLFVEKLRAEHADELRRQPLLPVLKAADLDLESRTWQLRFEQVSVRLNRLNAQRLDQLKELDLGCSVPAALRAARAPAILVRSCSYIFEPYAMDLDVEEASEIAVPRASSPVLSYVDSERTTADDLDANGDLVEDALESELFRPPKKDSDAIGDAGDEALEILAGQPPNMLLGIEPSTRDISADKRMRTGQAGHWAAARQW